MALTDESSSMIMPVAPAYGGGGNGFGFGDNGWWIILLFILLGGWGNNYGGGFGGDGLYPWMNQSNQISGGFRDQMLNTSVMGIQNSITSGFGDVQNALCAGFAGVTNGFAQAEIANNARQMANMQQMFDVQSSLQQCCCDNRAGIADLRYTVATEACADRQAVSDALRDVIAANTASTQRILDQMCNDKIDAKNEKIADLERQLTMANLAASQNAQTAAILANNEAQTTALEQYLAPVPRPAYMVQNPNCCSSFTGCGCGVA